LHTGQHYDDAMSGQFFRELGVPAPDIELGVGSGSHAQQTAGMLTGIERAIADTRPDLLLIYGDTNSTLAGALAAAKAQVPVAHVEAGLRSHNRRMPEEINRVVSDRLSTLLFCPGDAAAANLRAEGITGGVHVIGDVMADVLERVRRTVDPHLGERHGVAPGQYYLLTVHRADNTDDPQRLAAILDGVGSLPAPVLFPMHPRVKAALATHQLRLPANVRGRDPLGYAAMIGLALEARAVLTDSGGLQKEAYWLGVPCVTLRDETEWVETVAHGWNVLTGADPARICAAATAPARPAARPTLYGDGRAAEKIVSLLTT
jgi:UDP-N-acetylglucosamine 2-epimerase